MGRAFDAGVARALRDGNFEAHAMQICSCKNGHIMNHLDQREML
jgi:hypothetical protein